MAHLATITSKRQLTIPSALFSKAKFSKGDKVIIEESNGDIRITSSANLVEKLAGSVSVQKHLRGVDLNKAVKIAKKSYFKRK